MAWFWNERIPKTRHATTYLLSFYKKEVVPQYEFEKGTRWRDGFWRYASFKNIFLGSRVRGGGGLLNLVFYGIGNYCTVGALLYTCVDKK